MPTTTSCRRYPYPIDADPPDVANDMGKLARAIDADACTLAARLGNSEAVALNAVKRAGDTMSGSLAIVSTTAWQLALRRTGTSVDQPTLAFQSASGTPQFGTIMGDAGGLNFKVDSTADSHTFLVGTVEHMVIDSAGVDVTGVLKTVGSVQAWGPTGAQLVLVDNNGGRTASMTLYGDGTATALGTRSAIVGFGGSAQFQVHNEIDNGGILLSADGDAANVDITIGGDLVSRFTHQAFLVGKAAPDSANAGFEVWGSESAAEGLTRITNANNGPTLVLRHIGSAHADGVHYVDFADSAGTAVSHIEQDTSAPVGVRFPNCAATAPSDYRLKRELGGIEDAAGRVAMLRPIRYLWKSNPEGREQEGFLAHEVAEVVPGAVYGPKDGPDVQQLDAAKLVPLLTAAIIELLERVEQLEDRCG